MSTPTSLDTAKLAAAKLWLTATPVGPGTLPVGDAPYLSAAVYALITVPCWEVARVSADTRWRLYVNPDWLHASDVPSVAAEIAHVTWHLLSDHAGRAHSMGVGRVERLAWRTAGDACIAENLTAAGISHGLPTPADVGQRPDLTTEERYAVLSRLPAASPDDLEGVAKPDDGEAGCGSAADGSSRSYEAPGDAEMGAVSTTEAESIRQSVAIAYRQHLGPRGTAPGEWARWVERLLEPVLPWPQLLAAALRRAVGWTAGAHDYTYSRRSRRQAASPQVILPGMRRPCPQVAIVVDTSASMDDGLLAQALGEVSGVLAGLGTADRQVHVLAADAAVQSVQRVRRAEDTRLAGGGGTDMRVGIAAAQRLRPRPDIIVVLTDGQTPWPASPPPGAVLVVALLGHAPANFPGTPPWALRVECVVGR